MNLRIKCLCGKEHLLQIEKGDLKWECIDANERELGTETIYKASIIFHCFKCNSTIKINFYVYEYPEGRLNNSEIDYENCTLSDDANKNTLELEIETLFVDYPRAKETLGNRLRGLLTPYKCLIESIKSDNPEVLNFIRTRSDFQEGLDRLIEFSKSDIMESINYE